MKRSRLSWVGLVVVVLGTGSVVAISWNGSTLPGVLDSLRLQWEYRAYVEFLQRENKTRPTITQSDLITQIKAGMAPMILDVRTREEYKAGHIPGAINIDYRELSRRLTDLTIAQDQFVITYCQTGIRAGVAEKSLREAGFTSVLHLEGDMKGWLASNLPVQR